MRILRPKVAEVCGSKAQAPRCQGGALGRPGSMVWACSKQEWGTEAAQMFPLLGHLVETLVSRMGDKLSLLKRLIMRCVYMTCCAHEAKKSDRKFNIHKPTSQHYHMSYGLIFPVLHLTCPLHYCACVRVFRSKNNFLESGLSCYLCMVDSGIELWCLSFVWEAHLQSELLNASMFSAKVVRRVERLQMSNNWGIDEQNVLYPCTGIVFDNQKE